MNITGTWNVVGSAHSWHRITTVLKRGKGGNCEMTQVGMLFPFPHSIGYPVVTLGFGFKSYVSYKMRLRKQKEVQKENEFYMQLLQQALPPEQQMLQRQEREAEEGGVTTHT